MLKLLSFALFCSALAGCARNSGSIDLTSDSSGTVVETASDRVVRIRLASNPSTGYHWNMAVAPDTKVLRLLSADLEAPAAAAGTPPRLGAPGVQVWKFQTVGTGQTALRLEYVGPGTAAAVGQEYSLTVSVK